MRAFDVLDDILVAGGREGLILRQKDSTEWLSANTILPNREVYGVRLFGDASLAVAQRHSYSVIRPRGSNAIQGLGNWQPIKILDRDYEISSVNAPAMEVFAFKYLDDDALCILGSGSFQCLGNFAPKRWNSESGVPLAATETALTDDGYLWVSAGKPA